MLPHLDKRLAVLSAVGSVLKWFFGTATLLDVEELHKKYIRCTERTETLFT